MNQATTEKKMQVQTRKKCVSLRNSRNTQNGSSLLDERFKVYENPRQYNWFLIQNLREFKRTPLWFCRWWINGGKKSDHLPVWKSCSGSQTSPTGSCGSVVWGCSNQKPSPLHLQLGLTVLHATQLNHTVWKYWKVSKRIIFISTDLCTETDTHCSVLSLAIDDEWQRTQCMPRETCVDVAKELNTDPSMFFKPPCVSVHRLVLYDKW